MSGSATPLRLSRFAHLVETGSAWIVANVAAPSRLVVDAPTARAVQALARGPLSAAAFAAACPPEVDGEALLRVLFEHGLVVAEDADELGAFARVASAEPLPPADSPAPPGRYQTPRVLRAAELAQAAPATELQPLDVLLLGGCVLAFAQDTLVRRGRERGLAVRCRHAWPPTRLPRPLHGDGPAPDMVVLQPTIQPFLTSVWDDGPFQDAPVRARRASALARFLARLVDAFAEGLDGRLGLVHNVAPPTISPFGRMDFRTPTGFRELVGELNEAIAAAARAHEHVLVVDEERLVLRHGGERLFDDLLFPFGHHGGAADPRIAEAHQLPALSEALAGEYLALHEIFHGLRRVRCIAVDLDGVLWPGVLAEDGMDWLDGDTTTRWMHEGVHQALRLLEQRGILLVSLSKGSAAVTLEAWRGAADPRLLAPEDFVQHSIDWTPKPNRLRALAERLGLQPHDVLLLDDHPVERAEMRARMPGVRVAEGDVAGFRALLLSDPAFEVAHATDEARRRTETTQGLLLREQQRETVAAEDFLASLAVRVTVEPLAPEQLARACELLARTTQFNTLGRQPGRDEAQWLLAREDVTATAVTVHDRFAAYGLCGVVVIEDASVRAVVLSCRVIGLDVAVAMLVGSLRLAGRLCVGTTGHVHAVARNAPAHDLFARAGFARVDEERWEIVDAGAVARAGAPAHVQLTLHDVQEAVANGR
ncbi:MAG TPA: HAD-IIIC family phosphatase [Conexibacter sp.]|nr:HAD-IIIC family phosphatase [Conexibacter sp.]